MVFIDALALTSDLNQLPAGNSPAGSPGALPAPPKGTLVWREAELPDESNLGVRANVPFLNEKGQGASGGMYFNIDRKADAEKAPEGYYAQYDFNIPAPGAYHVWIAATPFNAGWASPCSIRWDDEPAIDLAGRRPYSPPYGFDHPRAYFFWTKAGVKNFTKAGKHTLRVIADRPRGNTDNIRVFLDAIALTADPAWAPRGNRPPGSPWQGVPKGATPEERKANFRKAIYDIQMQTYPAKLAETNEEWNPETTAERREAIEQEYEQLTRTVLDQNRDNLFGVMLLSQQLGYELSGQELLDEIAKFPAEMQQTDALVRLKENAEQMIKTDIGQPFIDIAQPNADGEQVSLESVVRNPANKYVLLDFWASWCGPCMGEVPHLKKTYDEFRKKGFEIYGVSFDEDRGDWLGAVEQNDMNWLHVSEVKGFDNQAAKDYAIQGIPSNFLIDGQGTIVARNLRGEALYEKISELLAQ